LSSRDILFTLVSVIALLLLILTHEPLSEASFRILAGVESRLPQQA
jgi:hypothetical protein